MTYAYLDTADEIAPANTFLLTADGARIEGGSGRGRHKKGYELSARYLDIDYGSPYLEELLRKNENLPDAALSYEAIAEYAKSLYSIRFENVMSREEYAAARREGFSDEDMAAAGVPQRMEELAEAVTEGARNDYDRCRQIEAYLRQYPYSMRTGVSRTSDEDISTAAGMINAADRFLFETQTGYCVHYTAAMVMLLRLSGIPARAAVGYRYIFPFEKEEMYKVDGSCAHAWAEAYLSGAGWVPFEPTAACWTAGEYTWGKVPVNSGTAVMLPEAAEAPELPNLPEAEIPEEPETAQQVFGVVRILLIIMGVFIFSVIAAILCAGRLRYHLAAPEKRLHLDVEMIKRSIRRQAEEPFADRGLLSDYVKRAPEPLREDVRKVFDTYYRTVYRNGGPHVELSESEFAKTVREKLVRGAKVDEKRH